MCKLCGNPDCKVDEMFGNDFDPMEALKSIFGGNEGPSEEELAEMRKIETETHSLQDETLDGDNRSFTSKVWRPEDRSPVYSSIDTSKAVLSESIDALTTASVTGEVKEEHSAQVETFKSMLESMKNIMGEPEMSFCLTVSKTHVSAKVLRNGTAINEMLYQNIKTAEDVLKLVSYHSDHFVDPILKDYEIIKECLGSDK